jgi:LysM repeat protein
MTESAMTDSTLPRVRQAGRSRHGAVAAAAIPAVVLTALGSAAPALAAEPAAPSFLAPKAATGANIAAAQDRIAAHLVASQVPSRVTVAAAAATSVVVKPGDTLSGIAKKYGVGVASIVKLNGLASANRIYVGQRLTLRGGSSAKAATTTAASAGTYTVVSGDTLSGIAAKRGMGLSSLLKANGLKSTSTIYPGQKLKVSGSSATTASNQLVPSTFLHYTYPATTVASANRNKAILLSRNLPSRAQMKSIIASTARQMGVNPALALAHAYQESGFSMSAVSPANAIGAMQVIPSSGEWASQLVGRKLDLLNPYDNATAGVAIIRALQRTSATERIGIASYYQGQASVRKYGMFNDTKRYVANILAHKKAFS